MSPNPEGTVVVITDPAAAIRLTPVGLRSARGVNVHRFADAVAPADVHCVPLFGNQARRSAVAGTRLPDVGIEIPDLSGFYRVQAPTARLDSLAAELFELDFVTGAYVEPPTVPPLRPGSLGPPIDIVPPDATPNFSARQGYLDAAPGGVDARFAWTLPGGDGARVDIIDVELGGWQFTHEDLRENQGGSLGDGTGENMANPVDQNARNHATAVVGVMSADLNHRGIMGIAPAANVRGMYARNVSYAAAVRAAADQLGRGDILVLEAHRPGPTVGYIFNPKNDAGYIAVEWWEADYQAIRYAIARGIIVVSAAGNGAVNLDAPIFDDPGPGFPESWRNAFDRSERDSGSIIVGAGAPASGNFGPDRSRLAFSNYGAVVDAQGWGEEVTTTGYGTLQGGPDQDEWYTAGFSGTSSATPIVAGALACVQGHAISRIFGESLTPAHARAQLRATGTPQTDAPGRPASQRIGNRPSLGQLLPGPVVYAVSNVTIDIQGPTRTGGQLLWNRHLGRDNGSNSWSEARGLTHGWATQRAFTAGSGVFYAIQPNGDLLWRRHLGRGDGSNTWSTTVQVGHGWDFAHVFSGGAGTIYAVRKFGLDPDTGRQLGGDLLMYEHLGWGDGTPHWKGEPKLVATKWYYDHIFAGEDDMVYGITRNGDLFTNVHTSRGIGGNVWEPPLKIGNGWNSFEHVFYGGNGVIYAIDPDGGMWWYRHDGYSDNTDRWTPRTPVGHGWNFSSVFGG